MYGKQKAMILYKEVFEAKAAHLCGRSTLPATAVYRQRRLSANKSLMYSPLNVVCTDMKSGDATMAGFKVLSKYYAVLIFDHEL